MKKIDLTGERFGRLTVVERAPNKNKRTAWLCKCDCGNEFITTTTNLRTGDTLSCGCYNRERTLSTHTKHGLRHNKLYAVHQSIKSRCYNKNNKQYKDYGGRGITVCPEWLGENGAVNFIEWAMQNGYDDNLTIDRENNDGNYEPSNCRWVTRKIQCNNTRRNHYITYNGETHTLAQWAKITNISAVALSLRINRYHWDIEKALSTPCRNKEMEGVKVKKFTVTFNVGITKILTGCEEQDVVRFDDAKKKQIENIIKVALDADDADVTDYKVFMKEKDETEGA